jgi:hypothetical protein
MHGAAAAIQSRFVRLARAVAFILGQWHGPFEIIAAFAATFCLTDPKHSALSFRRVKLIK